MDDLTKIKGVGKASATKLAAAGYDSFAALAAATTAEDLTKLQEAGFAVAEIDQWVKAAAELAAAPAEDRPRGKRRTGMLVALQEIRHLGVTYGPGEPLPETVEYEEREALLAKGAAEEG